MKLLGRFEKQGKSSILFVANSGTEQWLVKVPKGGTDPRRSACAREWIYGRFAERIGLPTAPLYQAIVDDSELRRLGGREVPDQPGTTFTATPVLALGDEIDTWDEVPHDVRALLAIWENATAVYEGDKVRSWGPRDFFRWPSAPDPVRPVVVLDYEALDVVWNLAVEGRLPDARIAEHTETAVAGIPLQAIDDARDAALSALEGETWAYVIDGVARLWPSDVEPVRRAMRTRVEQAWSGLRAHPSKR